MSVGTWRVLTALREAVAIIQRTRWPAAPHEGHRVWIKSRSSSRRALALLHDPALNRENYLWLQVLQRWRRLARPHTSHP